MTETMKTLLAALPQTLHGHPEIHGHPRIPEQPEIPEHLVAADATTFVQVWERHVSLCVRVAERLVVDFGLTDLAQVIDRHMELFLLVDRASKITATAIPAAVLPIQQAIAARVETAGTPDELVLLIRESPHIAGELQQVVRTQTTALGEPLVLALGLVADDRQGLRTLLEVFTPDTDPAASRS